MYIGIHIPSYANGVQSTTCRVSSLMSCDSFLSHLSLEIELRLSGLTAALNNPDISPMTHWLNYSNHTFIGIPDLYDNFA